MTEHTVCRICETALPEPFLDLGEMPLANSFLASPAEFPNEKKYPLAVTHCSYCGLVQLTCVVSPEEIYRDYIYVSATSETVRQYAETLSEQLVQELGLGSSDLVVEVGSNDGTVLKAFQRKNVKVLGVEPARNIAVIANREGVPTVDEFFSAKTAKSISKEQGQAAILLGRHVFAHIHDLHDFMEGVKHLLRPEGSLLIEVPYLGDLVEKLEFDTIYHEHLSYFALKPVEALCERCDFSLVDVERVPLHGGSILLTIRKGKQSPPTARLKKMFQEERNRSYPERPRLEEFAKNVLQWKEHFEEFVGRLSQENGLIGYGAAAKANTLLNFVPRVAKKIKYILDKNPHKQGRFTPGSHIPVVPVEAWEKEKAGTHMVILAWNLQEEIRRQLGPFAERGGRFVIPIPRPEVV